MSTQSSPLFPGGAKKATNLQHPRALALLHAPLLVPSDAAVRGTKPRKIRPRPWPWPPRLGLGLGLQLLNGPPHGTPGKLRIRNRGFLEGTIQIGTVQKTGRRSQKFPVAVVEGPSDRFLGSAVSDCANIKWIFSYRLPVYVLMLIFLAGSRGPGEGEAFLNPHCEVLVF